MHRVTSELKDEKKYTTEQLLKWIKMWHENNALGMIDCMKVIAHKNMKIEPDELNTFLYNCIQCMTLEVDRRRGDG